MANLKQLRQQAKLRAEEVAVALDVAVSSVRNWEQGRTVPKLRVDQMAALCRLYRCDIFELEQACRESGGLE